MFIGRQFCWLKKTNFFKLYWRIKKSTGDLIIVNILTLLVKRKISTKLSKIEGTSFINNMNNKGPKHEPWNIPELTIKLFETWKDTFTAYVWELIYDLS